MPDEAQAHSTRPIQRGPFDEEFNVQRNTIIAGAAAIVVAIVAFLVWQHMAELGDRLSDLGGQVEDLSKRAVTAEERAVEAEAKAGQAEREAAAAAESAEAAAQRELESADQARKSEAARAAAEERERLAAAQRREAKLLAEASAAARAEAEERELAAEKKRVEAQQAAATARAETQRAEAEAERAEAEKEQLKQRLEEQLDRMQRALGHIADTRRTALGLVMTLDSSQIEFDFDKADLRPRNREILSRVTGVLLTFENYGIQVFGHTDDVGTVDYNKNLSQRRAAAVREYLAASGIAPEVMTIMGMGKSSPLVQGTDPASRQRNRRVELAIVFSEGEYEAMAED